MTQKTQELNELQEEVKKLQAEAKKVADWVVKTQFAPRLRAMVDIATSELGIPISPSQFDTHPWLFNTLNGTVDLQTGKLRPHAREDLITKLVPIAYDLSATCAVWLAFLYSIFAGKVELIDFVQRACGYALSGHTFEQCLFFLYGNGANGKSTFLEILRAVLGNYAQQTDFSSFLMQRGNRIRNDLARLQGARCVIANEAGEGRRLDEAIIKQLTGQDTVSARFLYGEFFEYRPTFKIFLAANHKPIIKGTDHGIWRRIKLIPFNVTFPPAEQDRNLREKLQAELPGILAWAVQGCLKWQKERLHSPSAVQAATEAYRTEMDIVGQFLDEEYIQGSGLRVQASTLYSAYRSWCERMGEYPLSHKMFSTRLLERGFSHVKSGGKMVWQGIGIEIKGIPSPPVKGTPSSPVVV